MGNFNFNVNKQRSELIKKGSVVQIIHDEWTKFEEVPDTILGLGKIGIVINKVQCYQSNNVCPPIYVCKVGILNSDKKSYESINVFPLNNLKLIR